MEKTIALESDLVFRHAVRLVDNLEYHAGAEAVSAAVMRRAAECRGAMARLHKAGKLDSQDLRIVALRQRTPCPTWREIGSEIGLPKQVVHRRAQRVKSLMLTALRA